MSRVTVAHVEARRASILEAAHKVFSRKGMQVATMAEIAEEAGVSAGAIYRYFNGKDALAIACFREIADSLAAEWHRKVENAAPMQVFREIAVQSFDEMKEPGAEDHTRLMLEHLLNATRSDDEVSLEAARYQRETIVRGLQEPLLKAQEDGQFPPGLDTYELAQALYSFYLGARMARLLDPALDPHRQLTEVQAMMDLAIAANPPA